MRFGGADMLRRVIRSLPPIAQRDAKIVELRTKLRAAKAATANQNATYEPSSTAHPSFFANYRAVLRQREHLAECGSVLPAWKLNPKDAGYKFAKLYGIPTPNLYGRATEIEDLTWQDFPDEFVLKAVGGTSARGVIPLRREHGKFVDLLNLAAGPVAQSDIVERLVELREQGRVSSEILVEEMLHSPYARWPGVPPDIKLYCFQGEVGLVMVRDSHNSRSQSAVRARYFSPAGEDLGAAMDHREVDPTLPQPLHLDELISASATLSLAIPTPFVRLDFFEQEDRIVFGEVTLTPGGRQRPRGDIDRAMGQLWERAEARLMVDAISAGLLEPHLPDTADMSIGGAGDAENEWASIER